MAATIQRAPGSTEYIQVNITANVTLGGQTVSIAVVPADETPTAPDFIASTWVTDDGTTCTARAPAVTYALGAWDVYAKVVSGMETPVIYAGRMVVG